ncbi:MAG: hypothetical protein ABF257_06315 [Polaribacter sp.]
MPSLVFGQFTVSESTKFSVNTVLSSLEPTNTFKSSTLGDGVFVLNGNSQLLASTPHASFPSLNIADANELLLVSPLSIRDDLTIVSGILDLQFNLKVSGRLFLDKTVQVKNADLLHTIEYLPLRKFIHHTEVLLTNYISSFASDSSVAIACEIIKKNIYKKKNLFSQYSTMPKSPPPKLV